MGLNPPMAAVLACREALDGSGAAPPNRATAQRIAAASPESWGHLMRAADSDSTRLLAVDLLSSCRLTCLQYVDDAILCASSEGALAEAAEAGGSSAAAVGQWANGGVTKTKAFSSEPLEVARFPVRCQEVEATWSGCLDLLGIPFERGLDGTRQWAACIAKSKRREAQLHYLRDTLKAPTWLLLSFFDKHVAPDATYGLELCIRFPWLEPRLNTLHHRWLEIVLDVPKYTIRRAVLFEQCGVCLSLFSRVVERACCLYLRIVTGSPDHPAVVVCFTAALHVGSWTHQLLEWFERLGVCSSSWSHLLPVGPMLRLAAGPIGRQARAAHKRKLKLFMKTEIRPVLRAMQVV
ncbi:unnamed protein product [Polarella glacialis]|uniref:Uncharacterized protein n=1 Tax=Polarella glacialis TaxID=89957 RepID=A0A813HUW0_POLGL|nr:unnamed protein product [Polarella glacialis]CAE8641529.1 unnamed protein product [Polarella glacialis]